MRSKAIAVIAALAAAAVALVVALPAGAAGNAGSTQVTTFDPTGAVFSCPTANYTVLGGTVRSVFHDSFGANGSEHVSGTTSPIGVTLTDGTTSAVYRLAGASWFGGSFNPATGQFVSTDTQFFNILGPSGGVVAKVAGVEHVVRRRELLVQLRPVRAAAGLTDSHREGCRLARHPFASEDQ